MRRGRTLILVLLIVIIALVVGFVALRQFLFTPQSQEDQTLFVEVYYAAQNIPQGGRVTEDVLATLSIPQENVVSVMYTKDELPFLVDKIAKLPLDQGVVITESMITDSAAAVAVSGPQWASLIPPGMTAMAIPIDRLAVSGYAINTGAHVNVNACLLFVDVDPSYQTILPNLTATLTGTGLPTAEGGLPVLSLGVGASGSAQGRLELDPSVQQPYYLVPSEAQRPRMVCQTLLQDVVVMRLGDFPLVETDVTAQAQPADPAAAEQQPAPANPDIVTLIVSPQDSITLSYLMYTNANITLTLRNPSDQARLATEASTLQFLLSQYNIPVPAKLPYAMHPALSTLTLPELPNDVVTQEPEQ
ncbi:MAG: SAF domain-containing protein [Chloroflexota bacterium]|jgi:pilus assembly protein CpaB